MRDLRSFVDRITRAMGDAATAERVEAVAAVLLDELQSDKEQAGATAPLLAPDAGERAVVTAYGIDHTGILTAITSGVSEAGCNILDVSQKIMQGYFTLIMLIDLSQLHGTISELQERMSRVGEELNVRIFVQHEDLFYAMHRP
ncbi:MAG: ACT domain-containing protein [Bacteroidota bacterium]